MTALRFVYWLTCTDLLDADLLVLNGDATREVVGIADLAVEAVGVLGRAHAPVDRHRLEDREIDHRAARQVAQLELAVDALDATRGGEPGRGSRGTGPASSPVPTAAGRNLNQNCVFSCGSGVGSFSAMSPMISMNVTPWRVMLPRTWSPSRIELDLGQFLRLAVLLAAGGQRGLEVDRDEERVLAHFPVPHRVHAEPADALAVHEVTVDDVDVADADVHVRLGWCLERLRKDLGHDLGVGEVGHLEVRDGRPHLRPSTGRRRRVLDPSCFAHRNTPENLSRSETLFRTVLGFSAPRQGTGRAARRARRRAASCAAMADRLPLAGLRVVDCTIERGELAARYLADLGAEVVKVEPPGGSPARNLAPVRSGVSLAWAVRNAGKLGVVLDLEADAPDDRERFHTLLDHADVLLTSAATLRGRARHARARRPSSASRRRRHHGVRPRRPVLRVPRHRRAAVGNRWDRVQGRCPHRHSVVPARARRRRPRLGDGRVRDAVRARTSGSRPVPGSSWNCRRTRPSRSAPIGRSRT